MIAKTNYVDEYSNYTQTSIGVLDPTNITITANNSNDYISYTYTYKEYPYSLEEKYYRSELLEEIRRGWHEAKKQFKNIPKNRPHIRLRGVSFCGRGWAI